jgi:hypothetical protein
MNQKQKVETTIVEIKDEAEAEIEETIFEYLFTITIEDLQDEYNVNIDEQTQKNLIEEIFEHADVMNESLNEFVDRLETQFRDYYQKQQPTF